MKKISIFIIANVIAISYVFSQGTAINTSGAPADNSAMLDVSATGRGLLIPRMTTANRPANPVESLLIFNTTSQCFEAYNAATSEWIKIACLGGCPVLTATDIDGNVYNVIGIGNQCWMKENLKVTKYKDGTSIPNITDNTTWMGLTTGAYCWYNNDAATYKSTYGAMYNWYAVNTGKLCPSGWHVPSDSEWTILTDYLGGVAIAGGKMKETGTSNWYPPNLGATNSSGFTGLPGAQRHIYDGDFHNLTFDGYWWTATEFSATHAWYRFLYYNGTDASRGNFNKGYGHSIRCLKD